MRRESKPEPLMLLPTSSPSPTTTPPLDSPMKFKFRMAQFPEDNKHDANLGNASPAIPEPSSTYGTAVKSKKGRGETCSVCGVTVASDIKRHMRRHLEEGEQERLMIKCPYEGCDVSKMQKSNLKSHIRAQHTFEYIYCPDEINCSFRTHDDASMLRHRKRYHGYQPYHRSSPASSGNAASPWKGKKSFLTKAEKSTLLGVEDLDILPQYIQPWKNVRPPPKSLPLSGQNPANHRKSSSTGSMGYTFVNESSPVPRHLVATPVELAPRITAGPVRGSTFAVQRMGPKSGMINDFLANGHVHWMNFLANIL
ncbi:hypothetical protein DL96DRAFT_276073 [Flagelloscypha sp. PMI_526]|nr:hypothetical protein DL96DRAFT_276073 [Flagelloscypha sp. PMI_526]